MKGWALTGTITVMATNGIVTFNDLGVTNKAQVTGAQLAFNAPGVLEITSFAVTLPATSSGGSSGKGGSSSGDGSSSFLNQSQPTNTTVIVNGAPQSAGTETSSTVNGQTTAVVIVNPEVIGPKIDEITGTQANIIEIPIATQKADKVNTVLTGDLVKKMEDRGFNLSVQTENINYIIPAKEITIEKVATTLGCSIESLKNITIDIVIEKVDPIQINQMSEKAKSKGNEILVTPVSFTIIAKTTSATGEAKDLLVSSFTQYVERVMEIPTEVDPSKITTGVVYNQDGTFSHVPTDVFRQGNKYYARLNSLTNSSYTVIWNPVIVAAVENHWSKIPVNDMASRLIIENPDSFEPNRPITRGDFAEYITKALGIYRTGYAKTTKYTDVNRDHRLLTAITIATEYGVISGYPDGTFRPNAQISREEAMAMYARAMDVVGLEEIDNKRIENYKDKDQVASWAYAAVRKTVSTGVFSGRTAETINPKDSFTYAEAATAVRNLLVKAQLINP